MSERAEHHRRSSAERTDDGSTAILNSSATDSDVPLEQRVIALWLDRAEDSAVLQGELRIVQELGVARTALREAIARLEALGVVYRRQGTATVVNRDALRLAGRFDEQGEFTDVIAASGHAPSVHVEGIEQVVLSTVDATAFGVEEGSPAIRVTKRWDADGTPARLAIDTVPLAPGQDTSDIDPSESILTVAERLRGEPVTWDLALPTAVLASADLADMLDVTEGAALLLLETIGLSASGHRLYRSHDYHVPGVVPQGLIRSVRNPGTVPRPR